MYPVEVACVNFKHEPNIGYVVRAAACFGARRVHVIGSLPDSKELREVSGTTSDFTDIQTFPNPNQFLNYCRDNRIGLVSAELADGAEDINNFRYPLDRPICIVVGNENTGVPVEILQHSQVVSIPMPGVGWCLNTAATAHIMLYEYARQARAYSKESGF